MSGRSEERIEIGARASRRQELRNLLVSAANAARQTRQSVMDATLNRGTPRAIRERISVFLAAAR